MNPIAFIPPALARRRRHPWALCAWLVCMAAQSACVDDGTAALAAADLAASEGDAPREEALLRTVAARMGRQRTRRGDATPAEALRAERALHRRLAELYAGPLHAPRRAIATLQAALALAPAAEEAGALWLQAGDLYAHRLHDRAQAAKHFTLAANVLGARLLAATAHLAAGDQYLVLGNAARAGEAARAVLAQWPSEPVAARAQLLLGQACRDADDVAGAIDAYLALLSSRPAAELAAVAMAQLAQVHHGLGEHAQALDYYHASLAAHPNAPMVQDAIARLRAQAADSAPHRTILQSTRPFHRVARR